MKESDDNFEDEFAPNDRTGSRDPTDSLPKPQSLMRVEQVLAITLMVDPRIMQAAMRVITLNQAKKLSGEFAALVLAGYAMQGHNMSFAPEQYPEQIKAAMKMLRRHYEEVEEDPGWVMSFDELLKRDLSDAAAISEFERWNSLKYFLAAQRFASLKTQIHYSQSIVTDDFLIEAQAAIAQLQEISAEPQTTAEPADAFVPFPIDLLPPTVADFIRETAASKICDLALVALTVLTILGGAIGTARCIALKADWIEFAIIWSATILESGGRKTPPFEAAAKPLKKAQEAAHKAYLNALRTYRSAQAKWEKQQAGHTVDASEDPLPTYPPTPPIYEHIWTSDTTTEAVTKMLAESSKGLTIAKDELSDFIGNLNRYARGASDETKYLEWFGGHSSQTDRRTADPIFVKRGAVCITGTIQPSIFWRYFGKNFTENGFLARFLLAYPPVPTGGWSDAVISAEVEGNYALLVSRLRGLKSKPASDDFENPTEDDVPITLELTPEAQATFADFCRELEITKRDEINAGLKAALSKMTGYAAKFALIDHLVRHVPDADDEAIDAPSDQEPEFIQVETVERAIGLTRWFMGETRRIYRMKQDMVSGGPSSDAELVEFIRRKGRKVTARDVAQNFKGQYPSSQVAAEKLDELVEERVGRWQESNRTVRGGRPTKYFILMK